MSNQIEIIADNAEAVESGFERFVKNDLCDFVIGGGSMRLENHGRGKELLFDAQKEFPSAVSVKVYRYHNSKGEPTRACMRFVYKKFENGRIGLASWDKKSMEIFKNGGDGHR